MNRPTRASEAGRAYLDLQNRARAERRGMQQLLTLYVVERWLARLSASPHADKFVIKGGMLLAAYGARRPTTPPSPAGRTGRGTGPEPPTSPRNTDVTARTKRTRKRLTSAPRRMLCHRRLKSGMSIARLLIALGTEAAMAGYRGPVPVLLVGVPCDLEEMAIGICEVPGVDAERAHMSGRGQPASSGFDLPE